MKRLPPWRRPGSLIWFALALAVSGWVVLHMPAGHSDRGAGDLTRIVMRFRDFGRLFGIVGIAAFCGGMIEARRWHMFLAGIMGRLTRMARLPEIVGLAMPTALCSNPAANTILVSSYDDGKIRSSALIAGGMTNSYLAYVSHSIRVMAPVIGAVGVAGVLYFSTQLLSGFLVITGVLLWNRWYISRHGDTVENSGTVETGLPPHHDDAPDLACSPCQKEGNTTKSRMTDRTSPLPWVQAFRLAMVRALSLLFRMVCITVPLMLGIEWLLKSGAFRFWEKYVPEEVSHFFPAELMSIVVAQMGGLFHAASVAANLHNAGLIDSTQMLLAMLVGSAAGNPFRTMRRNLPTALGIFAPREACIIVLGMQLSRLITTIAAIAVVVLIMHTNRQEISMRENDAPHVRWTLSAAEIEAESFRIIEAEPEGKRIKASLTPQEWRVARRLIHTTADFAIAENLVFQNDPLPAGREALRKRAPIFCDSSMIRAGLSLARLQSCSAMYGRDDIRCLINDADVVARAQSEDLTRALCAAEKARPWLHGAIVLIGNAPLSLARIARYILEENVRPALVIGMPVGFVNVLESKKLLAECSVPYILLAGRRGGSPLAVTTLHAVMENDGFED